MINQDLEKTSRISHLSVSPQLLVKIYLKQSDKMILILKNFKINRSLEFWISTLDWTVQTLDLFLRSLFSCSWSLTPSYPGPK